MWIALIILVLLLAIYTAARTPKLYVIKRTQVIQASPEHLFPYINHPQRIQEWNPFVAGDPAVKIEYSGPAEGVGAQWSWDGKKAGAGQATIITSEVNSRVAVRLGFKRPFHVTNEGDYTLRPKGTSTEVSWLINESALIPRVLSVFLNLDKLVGSEFEKGLTKLKTLAEKNNSAPGSK